MSEKIDLTSFRNALEELEKMYARSLSDQVKADHELFTFLRTSVVKGFEYVYELAIKFIGRFLEVYDPENQPENDPKFRDLIRRAWEFGLVTSLDAWLNYRSMRNATSHGYQESTADKIYSLAPALMQDARFTLNAMANQIDKNS